MPRVSQLTVGKISWRAVDCTEAGSSFLREGRVVGPCWEKLKPKGPKGLADVPTRAVASFIHTNIHLASPSTGVRTCPHMPLHLSFTQTCIAPRPLQGYLAQKKRFPLGPYSRCLWSYGGPKGGAFSYEQSTPVQPKLIINDGFYIRL